MEWQQIPMKKEYRNKMLYMWISMGSNNVCHGMEVVEIQQDIYE
jgi:hypothetical protein